MEFPFQTEILYFCKNCFSPFEEKSKLKLIVSTMLANNKQIWLMSLFSCLENAAILDHWGRQYESDSIPCWQLSMIWWCSMCNTKMSTSAKMSWTEGLLIHWLCRAEILTKTEKKEQDSQHCCVWTQLVQHLCATSCCRCQLQVKKINK